MASYRYDRLSAQDNSFLLAETPNTHMHVAGLQIFQLGDLATESGGVDMAAIKAKTEAQLHLIPRYRQKIQWTPVTQDPVWVDDAEFSIDYHMRHTSLPRPGSLDQLKLLAARVMAQQLDRERPLWEMWVVEGLEGDRFAMISKIHHCMIDGMAGVDLAQTLMDTKPSKEIPEPVRYIPKPTPSGSELLRDGINHRLGMPFRAIRGYREFRRETENVGDEVRVRLRALGELFGQAFDPPSETPINGELGPHRRFDWLSMSLAEVKEVRRASKATLNDVVLNTAAGAFRRYLMYRGCDPAEIRFRVSTPVSMRREEEKGQLGNRVSAWQVDLPLDEPDPIERLSLIHETTQGLKDGNSALGIDMIMQVAEWTPPVLLSLGAQSIDGQTNTIITNVPGPQFPLYMLGAKLLEMMPVVPLLAGVGLGIALFSYDGRLTWGINADYGLVPDLPIFTRMVKESFIECADAVGVEVVGELAA
ncbi:MAG: wax ester/triacylglycerol synthase family O-acyltransferase [Deltaproteobacteria bacterium]|nr:wax ester/triacylglycerol synthase family O-acyltransferase [Deltaproteobacteria bacterium]MBW2395391.1 wax ester/triacylglycerol synthase family O-acyltransferase [Deltaproteobacteria bacterium]